MPICSDRSSRGAVDASDGCEAAKVKSPQTSATRAARDEYFEHNFALDVQTPQGPQLDDALTYSGFDGLTNLALAPGEFGGTPFLGKAFSCSLQLPTCNTAPCTDDYAEDFYGFDWSDEPPDCFRILSDGEVSYWLQPDGQALRLSLRLSTSARI